MKHHGLIVTLLVPFRQLQVMDPVCSQIPLCNENKEVVDSDFKDRRRRKSGSQKPRTLLAADLQGGQMLIYVGCKSYILLVAQFL